MFEALRDRFRYGDTDDVDVISYHDPIPDDADTEQIPDPYVENDTINGSVWLRYTDLEVPVWDMRCGNAFFSIHSDYHSGEETVLGSDVATLLTIPDEETAAEYEDTFQAQPFHIRVFCNQFVDNFDQSENSVEMEVLYRWAVENSDVVDYE